MKTFLTNVHTVSKDLVRAVFKLLLVVVFSYLVFQLISEKIVIRNGEIVWKHGCVVDIFV